jgi:nicotinamidase-related amidase
MSAEPTSAGSGACLLCLDVQGSFLSALPEGARMLRRCQFAVAAAAGLGVPVAFTEQVPQKLGPTVPELRQLAPAAAVYAKRSFSAFGDPAVRAALSASGAVEHLLLCGLETPICVYQTAIDALGADLQVTVLSDAVGARREADAQVCLAALARAGAHVLPAETVYYALLGGADHPYFKAYTQLVKAYAGNPRRKSHA